MNLQNLVNFYAIDNIDMFENCTVPEPLDINQVKNYIMFRCGLLQPIYSEPAVFKMMVKMWFDAHQWTFNHLCAVLEAEYSPIENVYESDHWTNQRSGDDVTSYGKTDTESGQNTLQHGETHTLSGDDKLLHGEKHTESGTDGTENTISADNSSTYQPDHKQDVTYGHVDTASGTDTTTYGKKDTASGTDTTGFGHVNTQGGSDTLTHGLLEEYDRLRHGNVGVTTNNQLINQELEMLNEFQVYEWIARKFETDNMIQVY